ncbi:fibronectin type III domain-containing protein [Flavobacterium limi]|nr:hypothetical protein [Flavobacterium limi]
MLKKIYLYLLLLSSFASFESYAQSYPISVSTQIKQPSPIYLSHYADASTINSSIKIQIVLNDLTISNRQVKLKIYFQGNGISFNTNDFVTGARPLYLEGGVPLQLTNVDLAPYFEYQNLLGLTPNQYAQPLPEGLYNIYVEVYDFATGRKLSNKTGTNTIIFQNDPPFLNLPLNNASFMQQNIQNIVFGWTPRSINVSNVEYEFSLVEIWDKYTPIQNAFAYSPPLYTTTTRNTTLQYGINEPQLIPGKKYAWRIKAKAIFGAEEIGVFKNNGYSEIFSFDYETYCTAPLGIATSGVSENQAKITWSGNIDNYDYQVNYREKNADSEWYKLVTPRENLTLSNLKPNAVYEYTVGASCEVGKYTHSTIKEFTTLVKDEIAFQGCGIKPDPKDLSNKNPLPELFPNDVVTAGDFPIVVLNSTGSNGTFTGDGYVTLPFLEKFRKLIDAADALGGEKINIGQFSRIKITFKDIGVNTDFKLISGEIVASYDKDNWDKMLDVDKITNDIAGSNGKPIEGKLAYEVKEDGVTLNSDGSTTIKGTNGESTTLPKSVYDQVYIDKSGDVVNIPANGSGAPTFIKSAEGGRAIAANTNGISSSGEVTQISSSDVSVTFEDGPKALYAFDELPDSGSEKLKATYETIKTKDGNVYNVNYKAVSDLNGPDILIAEADFENGKTKDDIVFKTNTGSSVDVKWKSATKAEITLKRTLNFSKESIIATVKGAKEKDSKDAAKTIDGKSDIAGKVNIWQLTKKPVINITLLSVNGATTPDVNEAKTFLNEVYNKVGIKFDVTTQKVAIGSLPDEIQCGDSGALELYTDDQNNIISQIESNADFKYNDKTYYVLYTGKSGGNGYKGFMPLGSQYAFVFNNGTLKTAAHELGHGIFGLKHPFSTDAESGKTDLLMDYGDGTILSHNDWDIIHSGGWKFYGFQKSSSGALAGGFGLTPNWKFVRTNETTILSGGLVPIVPEGMLGGFESSENGKTVNYIWNTTSNTYKVDGTGEDYPEMNYKTKIEEKYEKTTVFWLIYKNNEDCSKRKYIRTYYDQIKTDLAKKDLTDYITKINKIEKTDKLKIYSSTLGCVGNSGTGNGNGTDEQRLKDLISKLDAKIGDDAVASEVIILDKNDPKYKEKLADALKKASYILATYDSTGKETLKLQYQLQIPKSIKDLFPDFKTSDNCMVDYINSSLTKLHENVIYKNMKPSDQAAVEICTVFYQGFFGMWYCATNEESIANAGGVEQYLAGATHEAIAMIDVVLLVDGLATLVKEGLKANLQGYVKYYENLKSISTTINKGGQLEPKQIINVVLIPPYNTYSETIDKAIKIGNEFKKTYFTECDKTILKTGKVADICYYRYGQLTVMIVPILYTAGEYAVAKISQIAKMSKISVSLTENALMLNEKLAAKGVTLMEAEGKTLIKNATTGETIATVESKALKDIENALDDLSDLNSGAKIISLVDEMPIKGTPNSAGVSFENASTPIRQLNQQGNVITNNAFQNFSAYDGNAAYALQDIAEVGIAKEGKLIQMYPTDPVTKIIPEVKNVPVIQLVPYKLTSFKGKEGIIELIVAETESVKGVVQIVYASAVVAKKLKEEEEKKDKCTVCVKHDQATCKKFEQLQAKVGAHAAIAKLCVGLTAINANPVITELLNWDKDQILLFFNDVTGTTTASTPQLRDNIPQININVVNAWQILSVYPVHRKNMDYINQIVSMLTDTKVQNNLNQGTDNYKVMLTKVVKNHNVLTPQTKFNNSVALIEYLKALKLLIDNYDGVSGFKESLSPLKTQTQNGFDGMWFGIQQMNTLSADDVARVDLDFDEILDCGTATNPSSCKFDVEMRSGNPKWYEYKSYAEASIPKFSQLKAYFSRINSINQLEYVFEQRKAGTEDAVKLKFQNFLCSGCSTETPSLSAKGNELFEVIWNNVSLRQILFDLSDTATKAPKEQFKEIISETENDFYDFIKVR